MNSTLLIKSVSLGCVIYVSTNILCNIGLCRYSSDSVEVNIGIFLACIIHCVSSGVGARRNASSVLMRWVSLVTLSRNRVLVIGERVQS